MNRLAPVALISLVAGLAPAGGPENLLAGSARVISVDALPEMDGAMCEMVPAAAGSPLFAPSGAVQSDAGSSARRPLRAIADPYGLYSAVGIDLVNDEVVLQDENHFRILVYDRTANTPSSDLITEPKRVIAGDRTNLMLNSGLYIDPKNGDIYTVNNDSIDSTVVFSREARGNAAPDRDLHTPHGSFNIAVDEKEQEMFLTIEHSHAVVVFPKMASGEDNPLRYIQGDRTGLSDPHGIALDTKNDLIFVSNFGSNMSMRLSEAGPNSRGDGEGKENWPLDRDHAIPGSGRNLAPSITVFAKKASGDVAPVRVIRGPKTMLNWPAAMAIDSERGELYVANDQGDSVLVFSTTANGDAAPRRILKGPKTLLKYPNGIALDLVHDELWVANFGNHAATVYRRDASGDTAPLRVIRSGPYDASVPALGNPFSVAFDSRRREILVPN
jgi:6-phosphogluconolactonase (cycloisomerase 2 family)